MIQDLDASVGPGSREPSPTVSAASGFDPSRKMTPTEARIYAGMKPGRWMTSGRIRYEFDIRGHCARENAAKHANNPALCSKRTNAMTPAPAGDDGCIANGDVAALPLQ